MQLVRIEVKAVRDAEHVVSRITVEKKSGKDWKTVRTLGSSSGQATAVREILIEDDERLIVAGDADVKYVYDAAQAALVLQPVEAAKEPEENPKPDLGFEEIPPPKPEAPIDVKPLLRKS